jgi:hypothetical protein
MMGPSQNLKEVTLMATEIEITRFRRVTNLADDDPFYDDALISSLIDEFGFEKAASSVWLEKAAQAASLVDTVESGSQRRLSQLYSQYLAMSKSVDPEQPGEDASGGSFTVAIQRV